MTRVNRFRIDEADVPRQWSGFGLCFLRGWAAMLLLAFSGAAEAQEFVPFVPETTVSTSPLSWSPAVREGSIAGASIGAVPTASAISTTSPRIRVEGDHFVRAGERVRFWGVNTTFGGNIPVKEDAEKVAVRMARAGINSVRFHHLDTQNFPSGIWDPKRPTEFHPTALDRLDWFIARLADQGISVNLNLHVGRKASRYLELPDPGTSYDKIANLFTPALIEAQKEYARQLLGRVNPYRGVRYADDPAVALVEITNENSFFMWDGDEKTRAFPPFYASLLREQFNGWLKSRYGSREALASAWGSGVEPAGENRLKNSGFRAGERGTRGGGVEGWKLEEHWPAEGDVSADVREGRAAARIRFSRTDETSWHLQFNQGGLALEEGRSYSVRFAGAAETTRPVAVSVGMDHAPWSNLGLSRSVELTPQWTTFSLAFTATGSDGDARVSFILGESSATVWLAEAEFRTGGLQGLGENESPEAGSVRLYADAESPARERDRLRFLAEREKAFFDEMYAFLRKDLGCEALITGSIVFGPLGLWAQSGMDFVDSHGYWTHPVFPGRPWDMNHWTVSQKAMTDSPAGSTLYRIAAERAAGRPFTVTEYNHGAPNDFQAECVPLLASMAAAQDWDGVWLFDYGTDAFRAEPDRITGFFGIAGNPAKWGFMRAGAAIFRGGGMDPLLPAATMTLAPGADASAHRGAGTDSQDALDALCDLHRTRGTNLTAALKARAGVTWEDSLTSRLAVRLDEKAPVLREGSGGPGETTRIDWTVKEGRGFFRAAGRGAVVLSGYANDYEERTSGRFGLFAPSFAVATATALDGLPLEESRAILLTGCGRAENVDMGFPEDRGTVGRLWGSAPVGIEPLQGTLTLPPGRWKCLALHPDGSVRCEMPVSPGLQGGSVALSAFEGTMWYLLTRV